MGTSPAVSFEWVNHASFVLRGAGVSLLADPWLVGSVFNDGYDLLSPTVFTAAEFARVTHIWYSHEHPDHFSPPTIRMIPEADRRRIVVLFQRTADRKVAKYCEGAGFKVVELESKRPYEVAPGFAVTCAPHGNGDDSWMLIETGGMRILNLNDVWLRSAEEVQGMARDVGKVDVIFEQFSYANWSGKPGDAALTAWDRGTLEKIKEVADAVRPRVIVPCASFMRFSHKENAYLNAGAIRIRTAFDYIAKNTEATPVVLYPGDRWDPTQPHDSTSALQRYERDETAQPPLRTSAVVPVADLERLGQAYVARMKAFHGLHSVWRPLLKRYFPSVPVYLTDLNVDVIFSPLDGVSVASGGKEPEIRMGSDSLAFLLKNDWGASTLQSNVRFTATEAGRIAFFQTARLGLWRNNGRPFRVGRTFAAGVLRRLKRA